MRLQKCCSSAQVPGEEEGESVKYNTPIVLAYFKSCGLPSPVTEHTFHPERKWRFDFAWLEQKVALEVEGGVWIGGGHNRGKGFAKDIEKYNAATVLGWRVLRCQPKEVCMYETAMMLKKCILQ